MEIWKDILGYEGHYQISNFGIVKSLKKGNDFIMKPSKDKGGYYRVKLCKGIERKYSISRLVAQAFLDLDITNKQVEVDHINNDKSNNSLTNIQLLSTRENTTKRSIYGKKTSKYVGVSLDKEKNKWRSTIRIDGKPKHLGYFITEEEAYQEYLKSLETFNIKNRYSKIKQKI